MSRYVLLLLIIVFLFGCVTNDVVCNAPYIRVGSECCLDINDNSICDIHEGPINQTIVEDLIQCSGNGSNYCENETRYYDAICEDGKWIFQQESCRYGCEGGICLEAPSCEDGTIIHTCSDENPGKYCNSELQLEWDCTSCVCTSGLVCYNNSCVTEEERTTSLVEKLENSVVLVEHFIAMGSGVILKHTGNQTIIITNKHVIEDAPSSGVRIITNKEENITVSQILLGPEKMDLAILKINGTYGIPATIASNYSKGQGVLALGSPLGLQGSVSEGIVSNIVDYETDTGYGYTTVQTDAAVNPGNSGGGLFLKKTGELIGINTFILSDTEGLNFAIDITEYLASHSYEKWEEREVPRPQCRDLTPFESCSLSKPGLWCNEKGSYTAKCYECGCPDGWYCSEEEDPGQKNRCFECPSGHSVYVKETGYSFCCPPGTEGAEDGTCS